MHPTLGVLGLCVEKQITEIVLVAKVGVEPTTLIWAGFHIALVKAIRSKGKRRISNETDRCKLYVLITIVNQGRIHNLWQLPLHLTCDQ